MLTIRRAKSLQGKLALPPSPDLFCLSAFAALAARRPVRIHPIKESPAIEAWIAFLENYAACTREEDACVVSPREDAGDRAIVFESDAIPYRDYVVFLMLGARKKILFTTIREERLEAWRAQARRFGCTVDVTQEGSQRGLTLVSGAPWESASFSVDENDVHPLLGILLGLRAKCPFQIDYTLTTPLRPLAKALGFEIGVKRDIGEKEKDPLIRRMRLQARQRLSSQDQLFSVSADFSAPSPGEPADITLPGDEVLSALFLTAKSFVHKGTLVIENAPIEPWATPVIALLRKMGCRPTQQETGETAFGSAGMISFQKFDMTGQKTECTPSFLYAAQLPSLAVAAAFSEGESIFRRLDDMRLGDPDGIERVEACLEAMNVKFGDMPDGFVIKGGRDYDGFDLTAPLPANLAGAFAVAGLSCMGSTTVNDEFLLGRWPKFGEWLASLGEYRT